jgi:hypothetical protein
MKGVYNFIVKPKYNRTTSAKNIDGQELILNTELQNHEFVSRIGVVVGLPLENETDIQEGDEVIVHHNVFRRFYDIRGNEKNSKSYYKDDLFFVAPDQIFAYKRSIDWTPIKGFNFVIPIKENNNFSIDKEKALTGILKYKDPDLSFVNNGDLIGFKPGSEYEFIIEDHKLYRVPTNSITIKYEYQGNEEEYNPSWAQSG